MNQEHINKVKEYLKDFVVMAPLAGYTNLAFRKIVKEMGATLVYTEMISAKGLIYENDKTLDYLKSESYGHPLCVQLFGGDPKEMVEAAKIIFKASVCDILDINMGCPVKKVLKQDAGSSLLLDEKKMYDIVKGIVEISPVPVSCKIRAGWDHSSINCDRISKILEDAGCSMIAIHGRTKSDLYSGKVNLDYIKMVKDSVSIPVIGNGDIKSIEDAKKMVEYTKCDAIMVGRSALGNPWLIKELVDYFKYGKVEHEVIDVEKRVGMIKYHYNELRKIKSERISLLEMRSLASWYVKTLPNTKKFKLALNKVETEIEFFEILDTLKEEVESNEN